MAQHLGVSRVSVAEFNRESSVDATTYFQRFGSWNKANKEAGLCEKLMTNAGKYTDEFLVEELKRVAKCLGKKSLSSKELKKESSLNATLYFRRFGSWDNAVKKAGLNPTHVKIDYERTAVPKSVMIKILKRDFHKCCICGASPSNDTLVDLEIDHIKPVSKGGSNNPENLWTLCTHCNRSKGTQYDIEIALRAHRHKLLTENIKEHDKTRTRTIPPKPKFKACNLTPDVEPNI